MVLSQYQVPSPLSGTGKPTWHSANGVALAGDGVGDGVIDAMMLLVALIVGTVTEFDGVTKSVDVTERVLVGEKAAVPEGVTDFEPVGVTL